MNSIELGIICFPIEEILTNKIAVLDLKKNDRKTKSIEFSVNQKNTIMNVGERSNHNEMMKMVIIKGFSDRAISLWDNNSVDKELKNLEEYVKNGWIN